MWVYHFHYETKEYTCKSQAYINPLESQKRGMPVYLTPALATLYPPPIVDDLTRFKIIWLEDENCWKVEERPPPPPPPPTPLEPVAEEPTDNMALS